METICKLSYFVREIRASAGSGVCGDPGRSPLKMSGDSSGFVEFHFCLLLRLTNSVVAALTSASEVISKSEEGNRCSRRGRGQWCMSTG